MFRVWILSVVCLFGCTTMQDNQVRRSAAGESQTDDSAPKGTAKRSSYDEWTEKLGFKRSRDELGYLERGFSPCSGTTEKDPLCNPKSFSSIYFRLRCRASDGTVEHVSRAELMPVVSQRIHWWLGEDEGVTSTDREGFGQILAVNAKSSKQARFALKIGSLSLGMTAEEVREIIVPRDWCIEANATNATSN